MNRRELFLSVISATALCSAHGRALAQEFSANPVDISNFAKRFEQPDLLDRVLLDVAYVQSWRVELAPRGYENTEGWRDRARENRGFIWQNLSDSRAVPAIFAAADVVEEFDKAALNSFESNRDDFAGFMENIGLVLSGRAAGRILQSLRDYALLNATVSRSDADQAAKESFFWPFC